MCSFPRSACAEWNRTLRVRTPRASIAGSSCCEPVMTETAETAATTSVGQEMYELIEELYPIRRSLTGDGVRETIRRVARRVPFETREVATGTTVYDWVVPNEWNLRDAWIADLDGNRIVDVKESPLHVIGYSMPIRARISAAELRRHAFTLPDYPDRSPYRTSYYGRI